MVRGWWMLAMVAWGAAQASAQAPTEGMEDEARSLFQAGSSAYGEGRYENALDYFARSYELSGRSVLLYNMAAAADRLRRDEDALQWYRQYLEEVPEPAKAAEVRSRISVLQRTLERPKAADESADADLAPGADEPSEEEGESTAEPLVLGTEVASDGKARGLGVPGWILVGVGAGMLVGGAITGGLALSLDGDLADRCDPVCAPEDQSDIDRRNTLATVSTAVLVSGGVIAAVGALLLLLRSGRGEERGEPAFTPVLGPQMVGGSWRRSF